jgi:primase-polymerase (primpol)-like protein
MPSLAGSEEISNVLAAIPDELKKLEQFACWRYEPDKKDLSKLKKVPYNPGTGRKASHSNPRTWRPFEDAVRAYLAEPSYYNGVSFAVTKAGRIVGGDLDHSIDPVTGEIAEWALKIIARFKNTYWEISPSGEGLRFFLKGALPAHGRKKGNIELYDGARFLTLTGNRVPGTAATIAEEYYEELLAFHAEVFGKQEKKRQEPPKAGNESANGHTDPLSDEVLLKMAASDKNGGRFSALYAGDFSGYDSQSEADLALSSHLAFYCGNDPARIDRLFRESGLYREKWDEKHFSDGRTYGEATIQKALADMHEFYSASNGHGAAAEDPTAPDCDGTDEAGPTVEMHDKNSAPDAEFADVDEEEDEDEDEAAQAAADEQENAHTTAQEREEDPVDLTTPPKILWQGVFQSVAEKLQLWTWEVWMGTYAALCARAHRNLHFYYYTDHLYGMNYSLLINKTGAGKNIIVNIVRDLLGESYKIRTGIQSGAALVPVVLS